MSVKGRRLFAMNNPSEPLDWEIPFLMRIGFDGVELTLEHPESYFDQVETHWDLIKQTARIGHTRDDLAFASENSKERETAIQIMKRSLDTFAKLGIGKVNIHPHRGPVSLSYDEKLHHNAAALNELIPYANSLHIQLMLENQPPFPSVLDLKRLQDLTNYPIYLLLDLAHAYCYCGDQGTKEMIEFFGQRIAHVHLSDNRGEGDEHLFPRYGTLNFPYYFEMLRGVLKENVDFSLESFRIFSGDELRTVTREEREIYVGEAVKYLKNLLLIT
jgi:sugar phosphate isomerase/epimerase